MDENQKEDKIVDTGNTINTPENNDKPKEDVRTEDSNTVDAEELKNETVSTVKQVKETMRNVDIKQEAKATKGFITEMFKNPLGKIKEIANDKGNKYFKTAIVLVVIWTVAVLLGTISFKYFSWRFFGTTVLGYIKAILAPVVGIVVMSLIIFLMNKKSKKSLTTVLTTVTTAKLPIVVAEVISLLTLFNYDAKKITTRITSLATIISAVFMYFAIKELFGEKEDKSAIKTFVIVEAIYYIAAIVILFLGVSI